MVLLRVDLRGRVLDPIIPEGGEPRSLLVPGSTLLPLVGESSAGALLDFLLALRQREAVWSWPLAASAATGWSRIGLAALRAPLAALVTVAEDALALAVAARAMLAVADRYLSPPPRAAACRALEDLIERATATARESTSTPAPERILIELLAEREREIERLSARVVELETKLRQR